MSEIFFKNRKGQKLCACLSGSKGSIVVALHGFGSNKDGRKFNELEKRLVAKGIAMFRYDAAGCGDSEGDFQDKTLGRDADNLHDAIEFIKNDYSPISVFGSSWGGMVAIVEAARNPLVKKLALASPVTDFKKYESYFGPDAIEEASKTGILRNISDSTGEERRLKLEFLTEGMKYRTEELARSIKCPVLLLHGEADDVISIEDSERFVGMLESEKRLVRVKDCGHLYEEPEHFKQLIDETVGFFT